jgi:hypothetical protein
MRAPHAVAEDGDARGVDGKVGVDELGKLLGHVVVHTEVLRPLGLRGVDVEARAEPKVPRRVGTLDLHTTRAGVGADQSEAVLGGSALSASLGDEVLIGAGEA